MKFTRVLQSFVISCAVLFSIAEAKMGDGLAVQGTTPSSQKQDGYGGEFSVNLFDGSFTKRHKDFCTTLADGSAFCLARTYASSVIRTMDDSHIFPNNNFRGNPYAEGDGPNGEVEGEDLYQGGIIDFGTVDGINAPVARCHILGGGGWCMYFLGQLQGDNMALESSSFVVKEENDKPILDSLPQLRAQKAACFMTPEGGSECFLNAAATPDNPYKGYSFSYPFGNNTVSESTSAEDLICPSNGDQVNENCLIVQETFTSASNYKLSVLSSIRYDVNDFNGLEECNGESGSCDANQTRVTPLYAEVLNSAGYCHELYDRDTGSQPEEIGGQMYTGFRSSCLGGSYVAGVNDKTAGQKAYQRTGVQGEETASDYAKWGAEGMYVRALISPAGKHLALMKFGEIKMAEGRYWSIPRELTFCSEKSNYCLADSLEGELKLDFYFGNESDSFGVQQASLGMNCNVDYNQDYEGENVEDTDVDIDGDEDTGDCDEANAMIFGLYDQLLRAILVDHNGTAPFPLNSTGDPGDRGDHFVLFDYSVLGKQDGNDNTGNLQTESGGEIQSDAEFMQQHYATYHGYPLVLKGLSTVYQKTVIDGQTDSPTVQIEKYTYNTFDFSAFAQEQKWKSETIECDDIDDAGSDCKFKQSDTEFGRYQALYGRDIREDDGETDEDRYITGKNTYEDYETGDYNCYATVEDFSGDPDELICGVYTSDKEGGEGRKIARPDGIPLLKSYLMESFWSLNQGFTQLEYTSRWLPRVEYAQKGRYATLLGYAFYQMAGQTEVVYLPSVSTSCYLPGASATSCIPSLQQYSAQNYFFATSFGYVNMPAHSPGETPATDHINRAAVASGASLQEMYLYGDATELYLKSDSGDGYTSISLFGIEQVFFDLWEGDTINKETDVLNLSEWAWIRADYNPFCESEEAYAEGGATACDYAVGTALLKVAPKLALKKSTHENNITTYSYEDGNSEHITDYTLPQFMEYKPLDDGSARYSLPETCPDYLAGNGLNADFLEEHGFTFKGTVTTAEGAVTTNTYSVLPCARSFDVGLTQMVTEHDQTYGVLLKSETTVPVSPRTEANPEPATEKQSIAEFKYEFGGSGRIENMLYPVANNTETTLYEDIGGESITTGTYISNYDSYGYPEDVTTKDPEGSSPHSENSVTYYIHDEDNRCYDPTFLEKNIFGLACKTSHTWNEGGTGARTLELWEFDYNAIGKLKTSTALHSDNDLVTEERFYTDEDGNESETGFLLSRVVDAEGVSSLYQDYVRGQPTKVTTGVLDGDITDYITTVLQLTATKELDNYGRVTSETDPLGRTTYYCYEFCDVTNEAESIKDVLGRPTVVNAPAPAQDSWISYDDQDDSSESSITKYAGYWDADDDGVEDSTKIELARSTTTFLANGQARQEVAEGPDAEGNELIPVAMTVYNYYSAEVPEKEYILCSPSPCIEPAEEITVWTESTTTALKDSSQYHWDSTYNTSGGIHDDGTGTSGDLILTWLQDSYSLYDLIGQVLEAQAADQTGELQTTTFTYDYNPEDNIVTITTTDPLVSNTHYETQPETVDEFYVWGADLKQRAERHINRNKVAINFDYDDKGRLSTKMIYPYANNTATSYEYDDLNRVEAICAKEFGCQVKEFLDNGLVYRSFRLPNGIYGYYNDGDDSNDGEEYYEELFYTYDSQGHNLRVGNDLTAPGLYREFAYDEYGLPVSEIAHNDDHNGDQNTEDKTDVTTSYSYDELFRLQEEITVVSTPSTSGENLWDPNFSGQYPFFHKTYYSYYDYDASIPTGAIASKRQVVALGFDWDNGGKASNAGYVEEYTYDDWLRMSGMYNCDIAEAVQDVEFDIDDDTLPTTCEGYPIELTVDQINYTDYGALKSYDYGSASLGKTLTSTRIYNPNKSLQQLKTVNADNTDYSYINQNYDYDERGLMRTLDEQATDNEYTQAFDYDAETYLKREIFVGNTSANEYYNYDYQYNYKASGDRIAQHVDIAPGEEYAGTYWYQYESAPIGNTNEYPLPDYQGEGTNRLINVYQQIENKDEKVVIKHYEYDEAGRTTLIEDTAKDEALKLKYNHFSEAIEMEVAPIEDEATGEEVTYYPVVTDMSALEGSTQEQPPITEFSVQVEIIDPQTGQPVIELEQDLVVYYVTQHIQDDEANNIWAAETIDFEVVPNGSITIPKGTYENGASVSIPIYVIAEFGEEQDESFDLQTCIGSCDGYQKVACDEAGNIDCGRVTILNDDDLQSGSTETCEEGEVCLEPQQKCVECNVAQPPPEGETKPLPSGDIIQTAPTQSPTATTGARR